MLSKLKMKRVFIIFLFFFMKSTFSCEKREYTIAEAYKKSDYVFSGEIMNLRYLDDVDQVKLEPRIIVTFKINKIWKGEENKQIVLHTTHNKGSCNGFVFKSGTKYLIYAVTQKRANNFLAKLFSKKEPTIGVKIYGGTKPLSDAEKDIKYLNELKKDRAI